MNTYNFKEQVGNELSFGAWISNKRSSGKIAFLKLRYGKGFIQAVALKEKLGEEKYNKLRHLPQETSINVKGIIKENIREASGVELELIDYDEYYFIIKLILAKFKEKYTKINFSWILFLLFSYFCSLIEKFMIFVSDFMVK